MFAPGGLACMDCKTEVLNELFLLLLLLNINFFFLSVNCSKNASYPFTCALLDLPSSPTKV